MPNQTPQEIGAAVQRVLEAHPEAVVTVVNHNPEDPGTWTFNCPTAEPLYMTADGRIVGGGHPDAIQGASA